MQNLRSLLQLSRQEWPLLATGLVFLLISSAALLAYPYAIKSIIDEAIALKNQSQLNRAAFLAIGIFAVQAITSAWRYYFFTLAGERTVKRLRERLFAQILSLDMSFFDRQKTGELLARLGSDTGVLQNALSVNISMLVRGAAQALGAIFMLFMTSARLTTFILLVVPPLALLAARFGKSIKQMSRRSQDALAGSSGVAEEGLAGVRTVKAFAQEGFELARYQRRLEHALSLAREKIVSMARFTALASAVGLASLVMVVWYGGTLVIQGELTVGTLTSFLLYVMTVGFSVGMLASLWTDFMSALGASTRIFQILEEKPALVDGNYRGKVSEGRVEFRGVHFAYPARPAVKVLQGVDFVLQPRETVAVVGASGSGKSTLVQLLLRFYDPQSGQVLIDNKPLSDWSLRELRQSIGVVTQEPVLVSESLADNIRYGAPAASQLEIAEAARLAFAHDFIMAFPQGYDTLVGERGIQLSGGQKQRVAIARALIKKPAILVLDEATSALDAESEYLVQEALERLLGKRTTLIIAHRLSTVKRADKILVMQGGVVVQAGTHHELMSQTQGHYHKLVEKQFSSNQEMYES